MFFLYRFEPIDQIWFPVVLQVDAVSKCEESYNTPSNSTLRRNLNTSFRLASKIEST